MFLLLLLLLLQGAAVETLVLNFTNRTTLSPGHLAVAAEVEMRHASFVFFLIGFALNFSPWPQQASVYLFFFSLKFFHSVNSYPYGVFFSQCPSCRVMFMLEPIPTILGEGGVAPWTKHIRTLSYQRKIFHTVQKTSHKQHQLQLKSQSHYKNQLLFSVVSLVRISRSASE